MGILGRILGNGLTSTRRYNSKTYHLFVSATTRREAEQQVERLRKNGYNARPFAGQDVWGVYAYPKPPKWYSGVFLTKRRGK